MTAANEKNNLNAKQILLAALAEAVGRAREKGLLQIEQVGEILVQRPSDPTFGDYSTNLAMSLAREAKLPPRKIAEIIIAELQLPENFAEEIAIAGAGFINFRLHPKALWDTVSEIFRLGETFGRSNAGKNEKVLIEYVSANPTGPVAVVQGRAGAIGDVLANLLDWAGYQVQREYYINDALNSLQVQKFAASVEAWYLRKLGQEAELPEDGYQGDYVAHMAEEIAQEAGDRYLNMPPEARREEFVKLSLQRIIAGQRADLEAYGVRFDNWFWESELYKAGAVEQVIERLKELGHTYEADGAVWLKTSEFGHIKDEVLVRSNGLPTYLAADIAYHRNKFERGFDRLIDIWGPDHHGHVTRMKAGVQALGYSADKFEIMLHQIVRLFSGGEMVRMSKRAGDIIPLRDLIDEVGPDAARFFFLMRSADSHLDFDLELAKKESSENPVYYVQYAHARICSIFRSADEHGVILPKPGAANLSLLQHPRELDLIRKLADFPEEIETAAALREPHRMTRYAQEIASMLHLFYTDCRVLGDDPALTQARLALLQATRIVLQNTLGILGISAPESM